MTTTILLADDHTILRQGLHAMLAEEPDFQIVGEARDGKEAAQKAQNLRPDVIILDLAMPGLGGLEATQQIRQHNPRARVLILSMYYTEPYIAEALRYGASGYVNKQANLNDLMLAIRQVMQGKIYLSDPFTIEDIEAYLEKTRDNTLDPYETLTSREREVLQLAAQGWNNLKIAGYLGIGERTVETYRANILRKLNLNNQTELVLYAVRKGILPNDSAHFHNQEHE